MFSMQKDGGDFELRILYGLNFLKLNIILGVTLYPKWLLLETLRLRNICLNLDIC